MPYGIAQGRGENAVAIADGTRRQGSAQLRVPAFDVDGGQLLQGHVAQVRTDVQVENIAVALEGVAPISPAAMPKVDPGAHVIADAEFAGLDECSCSDRRQQLGEALLRRPLGAARMVTNCGRRLPSGPGEGRLSGATRLCRGV